MACISDDVVPAGRLKHWASLNDLGADVPGQCSAGRLWVFLCLALAAQCGQGTNTELKEKTTPSLLSGDHSLFIRLPCAQCTPRGLWQTFGEQGHPDAPGLVANDKQKTY